MDFFQAQENARKKTWRLVSLYIAAIAGIALIIYAVVVVGLGYATDTPQPQGFGPGYSYTNAHGARFYLWQPELLLYIAAAVGVIIGLGSLFKTFSLRAGGGVVAESLGGQRIKPNTTDPQHRRLLNIVEEMGIAAGIRMPAVYVLPESGINAFAAGYSPDDAAVAVSQGALDALSRDELQGVVAHEFSHILNGDMRLNIKLIGLVFGILLLTIIGRIIMRVGFSGNRRNSKGGGSAIVILGGVIIIVGYIGVFFGRLIQAAVSRQREFLADASAVQFTRNPDGITGALRKIALAQDGSRIVNPHATETSHMFFASALRGGLSGLFATHPPLDVRIKAIDPTFNGDFRVRKTTPAPAHATPTRTTPSPLPGVVKSAAFLAALGSAAAPDARQGAAILEAIPQPLKEAARDPARSRAILLAILYDAKTPATTARHDAIIARALTPVERHALTAAVPQIAQTPAWAHIPLADIALASARYLGDPQVDALIAAIDDLIAADGDVSLQEYALRKVIHRNLRPPGNPGTLTKTCDALADEISILLTALARAGATDVATIQHAFDTGAAQIRAATQVAGQDIPLALMNPDTLKPDALTTALDSLDAATPAVKQALLQALVSTASADGTIAPAEQELLRAISAALNCPAPVLMQA